MTKADLAEKLDHLDPGVTLTVEEAVLAQIFGTGPLTQEVVEAIEAFALEHRCTFLRDSSGHHPPTFEKDDVF